MIDKPYSIYEVSGPRRHRAGRIFLWCVVGLFLLALAGGGGSYFWFGHMVGQANGKVSPAAKAALASKPVNTLVSPAIPESPSAMDILVLGSDSRGNETNGRSDSLMLVHVDPAQNYLSILSFPRDLRVSIPGHGLDKINAAYSYGGAALSIRTVKELTGVNVNHFVQIDFAAFEDLTNALGGVYIDVDRRYYNADPTRELIKISPGYQLLDGHNALEYVRFRHDMNGDFGRMERQQRFLATLRGQLSSLGAGLLLKLPGITNALFSNIGTDLSANDMLKLAYWGLKLNGDNIRQVRITGDTPTIGGVSYVVADTQTILSAVNDLVTPTGGSGSTAVSRATNQTAVDSSTGTSVPGQPGNGSGATATVSTIPNSSEWRALAGLISFPVEGPGYLPSGYKYVDRMPQKGGTYDIKVGSGTKPAFKMIYRYESEDQYLGITETTWVDAPMAGKGGEINYDGTVFTVVGTNQKVDHVWWVRNGVLYWVSNTLSYMLDKQELVKMAESFIPVPRP